MQNNVENAPIGNAPAAATKTPATPVKVKSQLIPTIVVILIFLYGFSVFAIIFVDSKIAWMPQDVIGSIISDIKYYRANPAKVVPDVSTLYSELPVRGFVDEPFIPALELINREPRFKYIADMVVQYQIPIVVGDESMGVPGISGARGKYTHSCPIKTIGELSIHPFFANADADTVVVAGLLIHELTHVYDKIDRPDYYCTANRYLSNEMNARKNEYLFMYEYDRALFFGFDTIGMINLRGNLNDYCIYRMIKSQQSQSYSDWIDDVGLSPSPESNEGIVCSITSVF